jgi:hypothetical protein
MITPDVALVGAVNEQPAVSEPTRLPVVLLLRKEGDNWKIASMRLLAPQ